PVPTFQCEFCGKTRERRLCKTKDGKHSNYDYSQRFCSKDCGYKGRRWRPINPEGHVHSTGYRRLHLRGGGKAFQHRVIMSEMLKRELVEGENVHHKDGDRLNNAPSNLELWTKKQPPGQRVIDKVDFAIEMLTLYPEFARSRGYELQPVHAPTADPPAPNP
ncbi:MAG: HNH endonuclease, partial [Candidatus Sulfotelmatobacter sp.]